MEYEIHQEGTALVVKEKGSQYAINLQERLLIFVVDIIKFLFLLPFVKEMEVFRFQLSKSGTSIGANYSPGEMLPRSKPDRSGLFHWVNPVK